MEAQKFVCKKCLNVIEVESFEEIVELKKVCLCCQRKGLKKVPTAKLRRERHRNKDLKRAKRNSNPPIKYYE